MRLYDFTCRFGFEDHWLLGERVDAFVFRRRRFHDDIQFHQARDDNLSGALAAKLLGDYCTDRIKRYRSLLLVDTTFLSQGFTKLGLAHFLVGHNFLLSFLLSHYPYDNYSDPTTKY